MGTHGPIDALQAALGYRFREVKLLERALSHGSVAGSHGVSNERLEFLGDRVLGLVVASALYRQDRGADEGDLARRYNALVRAETCAERAEALGIGAALRLGQSEQRGGGRKKQAILADACEAVLAAVYLDADFATAEDVVLRAWEPLLAKADTLGRDPKTELQERLQAAGEPPPVYTVAERSGPDHAPEFVIEVSAQSGAIGRGKGGSKRAAEAAAAQAALAALDQ